MEKADEYELIAEDTRENLNREVNERLRAGWSLYGPPGLTMVDRTASNPPRSEVIRKYFQAVAYRGPAPE